MKRIEWRRGFSPAVILKRIDSTRTVNPAGGASFTGWEYKQGLPALHSMLSFPIEARDLDRPSLIWRSLAAVRGPLTPSSLLAELNAQLRKKLSTQEERFHVLTSISLPTGVAPSVLKIGGSRISVLAGDYPPRYRGARDAVIAQHHIPVAPAKAGFLRVVASVRAREATEAVERALRAVDLVRACWCFLSNVEMEIIGASWRPINKVRLGPVHTCHRQSGKAAVETVWFEPHHDGESPGGADPRTAKSVAQILALLRASPLRIGLEDAMVGYVRALDGFDQNTAFLSLWTVIERLVSPRDGASPERGDFDAIVRRCAFLFKDSEYHVEVLKHLKQYRNEFVHAGRSTAESKAHCFQLQTYFRALVSFYLGQKKFFKSLAEANAMLDLPPDRAKLRTRQRLVSRALKFLA